MHINLLFEFIGNYWSNTLNRRNFFIEFATQNGFDPLVAINWENIQYKQVKRKKNTTRTGKGREKG